MQGTRSDQSSAPGLNPIAVFGLLALVLAVRVLHFSSALQSPLSYQPGPDEEYYLRFGEAVAFGQGADGPEFTFMDPGYGYLLGAVFKLIGVNPVAVYLLQALLDTVTAYGILVIGRLLGRHRAGLYGALLYGLTSTAIMFSAALLKEVWVASYVTWWVAAALVLLRSERRLGWALFGVFCGIGVALRSTLLLFGLAALLLPGLRLRTDTVTARVPAGWASKALLMMLGMAVSLLPWSARNLHASGSLSPLPHNGGIVLHQAYNPENPESAIWIPPFVNYLQPSEIWRGYAAEADRRTGRSLSPREADAYWRKQALGFMREHPGQVLADAARKSAIFLADTEIPNNRSSAEERLFSPVLRLLPPPMAWLLAMGLAGLIWLGRQDRRWPIVAAPIVISWLTVAAFWAEDRFRFHAVPVLALSSGIWLDGLVRSLRERRVPGPAGDDVGCRQVAAFGLLAIVIGAASLYLGRQFPPPAIRWDHVVWGYIKMGSVEKARTLAERISLEQPDNGPVWEAMGYLAAVRQQYPDAVRDYQRAVALRPRSYLAHYNLAKALLALDRRPEAAAEARIAASLDPSADARALLDQAEAAR
jgi:tetratricopeptide (TPR) repeat protein